MLVIMTLTAFSGEPDPISFSVMKTEVEEGETVSATCSVSHSCPASPPVFDWSHTGEKGFQQQQQPPSTGQWRATSTLTFKSTKADHQESLQCTVRYKGGMHRTASKDLRVKCECTVCDYWSNNNLVK